MKYTAAAHHPRPPPHFSSAPFHSYSPAICSRQSHVSILRWKTWEQTWPRLRRSSRGILSHSSFPCFLLFPLFLCFLYPTPFQVQVLLVLLLVAKLLSCTFSHFIKASKSKVEKVSSSRCCSRCCCCCVVGIVQHEGAQQVSGLWKCMTIVTPPFLSPPALLAMESA